ncbi:sulfotransferase family protein [Singulisphaera sp. PoT]|uniref:sulfotransferase family protein n=1 Tax=Singulisphaera sp. PoT TaxID=3411797 RepID=UPI003BF5542B
MTEIASGDARHFFIVGPLRTGSSLLTRCIDDHPDAICLCESEINRALYPEYVLQYHTWRMMAHGVKQSDAIALLDGKKQDDVGSLMRWYRDVLPKLCHLYGKEGVSVLGDKSPDLFRNSPLIRHFSANYPLIYTVRDPRAILSSILAQDDATPEDKQERWENLALNYLAWKPYLSESNMLIVRYEDLIVDPIETMQGVYKHLGLRPSRRFMMPFQRSYPERFLWITAIDWETGVMRDFDATKMTSWRNKLSQEHLDQVHTSEVVREFMDRFHYRIQP